jgi:5-methylcytosine-specific restriction protein A
MPLAAPRPCAHAGCSALVPHGRARCQAHERERERRRGSAAQRGYGARWRAYRLRFLAAAPLCQICARAGRTEAATVVDHVTPHKGDEALFWDPKNHRPLCKRCHDEIVNQGDFGRPTLSGGRGKDSDG